MHAKRPSPLGPYAPARHRGIRPDPAPPSIECGRANRGARITPRSETTGTPRGNTPLLEHLHPQVIGTPCHGDMSFPDELFEGKNSRKRKRSGLSEHRSSPRVLSSLSLYSFPILNHPLMYFNSFFLPSIFIQCAVIIREGPYLWLVRSPGPTREACEIELVNGIWSENNECPRGRDHVDGKVLLDDSPR
ncbi:hypothetical protein HNY73_012907 [Argiope bruennichi]|uniref:Uncharacterized protein n=1 Tax=Argiope bruennichi TaxID=94029 RepID=A0A8T0EWD8_ARGBR|nr:hypothetical protein HNY73_012907 [Argiope bruennichi]